MSVNVQGPTGNVLNVNANGQAAVQEPTTVTQAGFSALAAVRDAGAVTGSVTAAAGDVSPASRVRVGVDTAIFTDTINYAAQNTAVWSFAAATMTAVFGSGYVDINGGSDVTSGHYGVFKTYRAFPLYNEGSLQVLWHGYTTQSLQANNTLYMGIGIPGTTASPTDGVYFQASASGVMTGVCNFNGTLLQTAAFAAPSANVQHFWKIVLDDEVCEFWIDGVLQGAVSLVGSATLPSLNAASPFFIQNTNTGAVATAQHFRLENVQVFQMDTNTGKPSAHIAAGMGLMSQQGQNGGTMGSTANYVNSTTSANNPTPAVPTNTTAALGSGLGGQFWETASMAVDLDGVIASYQNPASTATVTGRNLIITGVRWQSMVQTVLAGGPFVYACGLAFGHTTVSLATTESATAKAPRRFPLGLCTLAATAAVGSAGANFVHAFASPIVVQPGEFIAAIVKNIGTVGTGGVIAHMIGFEGYFE